MCKMIPPDEPGSEPIVERAETYRHAEHGVVDVVGLWKGVTRVERASPDAAETIVVRYTSHGNDEQTAALVETLDRFVERIDE